MIATRFTGLFVAAVVVALLVLLSRHDALAQAYLLVALVVCLLCGLHGAMLLIFARGGR